MKAKLPGTVVVLSLLAVGLARCSWSVQDSANGGIAICNVQVVRTGEVAVGGKSTLPNGTCLHTQLFIDQKPQPWWPTFACASVKDGTWRLSVPLRDGGAPDELDRTLQYELCAWKRGDPAVQSALGFDLTGSSAPNQ